MIVTKNQQCVHYVLSKSSYTNLNLKKTKQKSCILKQKFIIKLYINYFKGINTL